MSKNLYQRVQQQRGLVAGALSVLVMVASPALAQAQTQDACYDLVEPLWHEPSFQDIVRCADQSFWYCLSLPHCCLPSCVFDPVCLVTDRIWSDGWEETMKCDLSLAEAGELVFRGVVTLQPFTPWGIFMDGYAAIRSADSEPLPAALVDLLVDMGNSSITDGLLWPSRYHLEAILVAGGDGGTTPKTLSSTVIELADSTRDVLFDNPPPSIEELECDYWGALRAVDDLYDEAFKSLVHELLHTVQLRRSGADEFFASYVACYRGENQGAPCGPENGVQDIHGAIIERALSGDACEPTEPPPPVELDLDLGGAPGKPPIVGLHQVKVNAGAQIRTVDYDRCSDWGSVYQCFGDVVAGRGGYYADWGTATGNVSSAGNVDIRQNATVQGSVRARGTVALSAGVSILGQVEERSDVSSPPIIAFDVPEYTGRGGDVHIEPDQNMLLPVGAWDSVTVKSRSNLWLVAGTYRLSRLNVEPGASLSFDTSGGPTVIYIDAGFAHKGTMWGDASDIFIAYTGSDGIHLEGKLVGTLFAPNTFVDVQSRNVTTAQGPSHEGTIVARLVEVHQYTVFQHVPFAHQAPPLL